MQDESKSGGASAKQPPKKKWIVAGVVAVVLVVACGGMWIWHGQPSFCAAICHTPMDPYLATYEAQPGTVDGSARYRWRCVLPEVGLPCERRRVGDDARRPSETDQRHDAEPTSGGTW